MDLSACSRVRIKDQEWCGDFGAQGAFCFHTLTTDERQIQKEQWDMERMGMVCTRPENFADTKAALEKLCHDSGLCTYEEKEQMTKFFDKMRQLEKLP